MHYVKLITGTAALLWMPAVWGIAECTQGNLTRTVSVVYANPGQPVPCEVLYEKPSEQQSMTLWRAQNEVGYCEARASEFVEKLKNLGWDCTESAATAALPEPTDEATAADVDTEATAEDTIEEAAEAAGVEG